MKQIWIKRGIAIAAVCCLMRGSYAFLTDRQETVNQIQAEENEIEIVEQIDGMMKKVQVINKGKRNCYVRVRVTMSNQYLKDYLSLDLNTQDYYYDSEEQFYYYKKVMEPEEISTPVFTRLTVREDIPKELTLQPFEIDVYAESVGTENQNTAGDGLEFYQKQFEMSLEGGAS